MGPTYKYSLCIATALGLTGCFDQVLPLNLSEGESALVHKDNTLKAVTLSDTDGVLTAEVDVNSPVTQVVGASPSSPIKGSDLALPPGALAIPTNIVVEAGTHMSSQVLQEELGLSAEHGAESVGSPAVFTPTVPQDPQRPLSISLPLGQTSLRLQSASDSQYIVVYRVIRYATGETLVGAFSKSQYSLIGSKIAFNTPYFGQFSIYKVKKPVPTVAAKKTTNTIVTKQAAALDPLQIQSVAPLVVAENGTITIRGLNFRPSFRLAMNGNTVSGVNIASDVVSFQLPSGVPFGFQKFKGEQDGKPVEFTLLAQADRKAYPIITMEASGVCSGVRYYDANGNEQVGTRSCESSSTATTATKADSATRADTAGRADSAAKADSAASATTAEHAVTAVESDFARGRQGSDIQAAATITIPEDGTYFEVFGSETIQSIAMPSRAGLEVTLFFHSNLLLKHNNSSAPRLVLTGGQDMKVSQGDFVTFISVVDGWVVSNYKKTRFTNFYAKITSPSTLYATTDGNDYNGTAATNCYTGFNEADTVHVPFTIVTDDLGEFDTASKEFVISETGQYSIEMDAYVTIPAYSYGNDLYLYVFKNGSSLTSIYLGRWDSVTNGTTVNATTYLNTYSLIAGDSLTFKAVIGGNYYCTANNFMTFDSLGEGSETYIRIVKQ